MKGVPTYVAIKSHSLHDEIKHVGQQGGMVIEAKDHRERDDSRAGERRWNCVRFTVMILLSTQFVIYGEGNTSIKGHCTGGRNVRNSVGI